MEMKGIGGWSGANSIIFLMWDFQRKELAYGNGFWGGPPTKCQEISQ
jgi:hypothetical protein